MVSVVAMEAAGAPRVLRRRAPPPRGAFKTVGWMKTWSDRWMKEENVYLAKMIDFLKHKHEKMFFFHPSEISPNHPTIQQLFIPSIISSSNYPTAFHPI
jgi:hypothetical protein